MARRMVITGAGSGLGRAIALRLAEEPSQFELVGRRTDPLDETARLLRQASPEAAVSVHSADLRDPDAVQQLTEELADGPTVDVLVLNAGGSFGKGGDSLAEVAQNWRTDYEGNVLTTVLLGEALVPHLTTRAARVVAVSSVAGLRGAGSYGAAKSAVNNWVWWMSGRLAPRGITVNAVAPGFVPDTEFWTTRLAADPNLASNRIAGIPMGRAGAPHEVAEAVAHLTTERAGWTTGQILGINGGVVLGR